MSLPHCTLTSDLDRAVSRRFTNTESLRDSPRCAPAQFLRDDLCYRVHSCSFDKCTRALYVNFYM
jgi:hypothetical protein